jgi:hypothetical protein
VVTTAIKMHEEIAKAIEEKGEDWMVAALVDGSIGYHSPKHARKLVQEYVEGQRQDWCERCMCCYRCDLEAMILSDVRYFRQREANNPAAASRLIEYCRRVEKLSDIDQTTIGLMFPSLSL